jgi:hypothetical protein
VHAFVLQDWILVKGTTTTVLQVTQAEHGWLDLEEYQDVVFWLMVNEVAGTTCAISYQTSPTADETLFSTMATVTLTAATAPVVTQVLMLAASVPLARYVRWQLNGTGSWEASFRVMVAANSPGM